MMSNSIIKGTDSTSATVTSIIIKYFFLFLALKHQATKKIVKTNWWQSMNYDLHIKTACKQQRPELFLSPNSTMIYKVRESFYLLFM